MRSPKRHLSNAFKTAVGDEDLVDHEFENAQFDTWSNAMKDSVPLIGIAAKTSPRLTRPLVPREERTGRRSAKRKSALAETSEAARRIYLYGLRRR